MARQNNSDDVARLIINPHAGRNRGRRYARRIRRRLEDSGFRFQATFSRRRGDVEKQVMEACRSGCRHVVVAGGDGTVHEAANGILKSGADSAIGLIPLGTGNDFAKAVGLPLDWRDACARVVQLARDGQYRHVDAGRCDDFYFANGVGLGLDAIVTAASERLKWLPGPVAYVMAVASLLARPVPSTKVRIEHDHGVFEGEAALAVACNGQYIGGVFHLAPSALNDDGKFKLVIADRVNRWQLLRYAPKVLQGTHENLPIVTMVDTTRIVMQADPGMPVEADGEVRYKAARSLEIELLPGALRVLA